MDIKSLNEQLLPNKRKDFKFYNLFRPTIKNDSPEAKYQTYVVQQEDEMRIDLIFQKMYDLQSNEVGPYLENIDIILTINNIDNPLNITQGMVLKYPELGSFNLFRIENDEESFQKKKSIMEKLGKPNKQTKVDPKRKSYLNAGNSLPPTVNAKPKAPVTLSDKGGSGGSFLIGGL